MSDKLSIDWTIGDDPGILRSLWRCGLFMFFEGMLLSLTADMKAGVSMTELFDPACSVICSFFIALNISVGYASFKS